MLQQPQTFLKTLLYSVQSRMNGRISSCEASFDKEDQKINKWHRKTSHYHCCDHICFVKHQRSWNIREWFKKLGEYILLRCLRSKFGKQITIVMSVFDLYLTSREDCQNFKRVHFKLTSFILNSSESHHQICSESWTNIWINLRQSCLCRQQTFSVQSYNTG